MFCRCIVPDASSTLKMASQMLLTLDVLPREMVLLTPVVNAAVPLLLSPLDVSLYIVSDTSSLLKRSAGRDARTR